MSPLAVRRALPEDLPQIAALAASVSEAPRWTEAMYGGYVLPMNEAFVAKALFVAATEASLSGFAVATVIAGRAELENIAVAESARRAGVGSVLLLAVLAWVRDHGGSALDLEVRSANERAQAFYAAHGFQREGRRARYYSNPVDDAVLMRLDIDAASARPDVGSEL